MYRGDFELLEAIRNYVLHSAHMQRPELELALAKEFNMDPDEVVAWLLKLEREQNLVARAQKPARVTRPASPSMSPRGA